MFSIECFYSIVLCLSLEHLILHLEYLQLYLKNKNNIINAYGQNGEWEDTLWVLAMTMSINPKCSIPFRNQMLFVYKTANVDVMMIYCLFYLPIWDQHVYMNFECSLNFQIVE